MFFVIAATQTPAMVRRQLLLIIANASATTTKRMP